MTDFWFWQPVQLGFLYPQSPWIFDWSMKSLCGVIEGYSGLGLFVWHASDSSSSSICMKAVAILQNASPSALPSFIPGNHPSVSSPSPSQIQELDQLRMQRLHIEDQLKGLGGGVRIGPSRLEKERIGGQVEGGTTFASVAGRGRGNYGE